MHSRRDFIKKSVMIYAACSLPLPLSANGQTLHTELKTREPRRALVLCYSQTGFTKRYGHVIACVFKNKGLDVELADMRRFEQKHLPDYDLILLGSPVFYYDIPSNVSDWLSTAPKITGIAVATFVSFGGPEGNQHNSLCHALSLLVEKGGVPVGMEAFRSIPAYPTPAWDSANQRSGEHLPDLATYAKVRHFAGKVLENVQQNQPIAYSSELKLREMARILPLVWLNKKVLNKHTVDAEKCIRCLTCVKKCPVAAIRPDKQLVNREKCLACFGCLNNCPANAVVMEYAGEKLYGFPEYLRRKKISILEPPELQTCRL